MTNPKRSCNDVRCVLPADHDGACSDTRIITDEMTDAYADALEAQTAFWIALKAMEGATSIKHIEGTRDLADIDLETLLSEDEENA